MGTKASLNVVNQVPSQSQGRVATSRRDIDGVAESKADVEIEGLLKYSLRSDGTRLLVRQGKSASSSWRSSYRRGRLKAMLNNDASGARKFSTARAATAASSRRRGSLDGQLAESFSTAASSGGSVTADLTPAMQLQLTAHHPAARRVRQRSSRRRTRCSPTRTRSRSGTRTRPTSRSWTPTQGPRRPPPGVAFANRGRDAGFIGSSSGDGVRRPPGLKRSPKLSYPTAGFSDEFTTAGRS